MHKIIITKGLPGSGKSTWAKKYQEENPNTVRVNKDELRAMLHNSVHSKGRENFVKQVREYIVTESLKSGHDVIVDDTNFNPVHEQTMRTIAKVEKAQFEIKDFSYVPLDQCIKNDLKRMNSVGEKVIRTMYNQYLKEKQSPIDKVTEIPGLPSAVICDLDGTLCLFGNNNPYDRDFSQDVLNPAVNTILDWRGWSVQDSQDDTDLILMSGRSAKFRSVTEEWLKKNGIRYDLLVMRDEGDSRKDFIVKLDMYEEHIKGKYNVRVVIDDRLQVCRLWYSIGLPVFRVGDPDADF